MLRALEAEWHAHPPVGHLVEAYLDYRPGAQPHDDEEADGTDDAGPAASPATWLVGGRSVPPSEAFAAASTASEALAAAERMFFGEVIDL